MYKPVITMCVYRRPEYTRQVLQFLSKCTGINKYTVFISIEKEPHPDVITVIDSFKNIQIKKVPSSNKLGCNGNTHKALSLGFNDSDYVIHVEDDILLAPDALSYFEWARHFENHPDVFTVGAWRSSIGWLPEGGRPKPPQEDQKVSKQRFFTCWGWATWQNRWQSISEKWTKCADNGLSWDNNLNNLRGTRTEIVPCISRAINIGDNGGTHRGGCSLTYWANNITSQTDFLLITTPLPKIPVGVKKPWVIGKAY